MLRSLCLILSLTLSFSSFAAADINPSEIEQAVSLSEVNPAKAYSLIEPYLNGEKSTEKDQRFLLQYVAAKVALFRGEHQQSIDHAKKAQIAAIGDVQLAKVNNLLGAIYLRLGNYDESGPYIQSALEFAERSNDDEQLAAALNLDANYLFVSGDVERAIEQFDSALSIMEDLKDHAGVLKIKANLGNIHLQLGRFEEAVSFLEPCYELIKESGNAQMLLVVGINLASAYGSLGDLQAEKNMYLNALEVAQESGYASYNAGIYLNLSDLNIREKQWENAIGNATLALELAVASNDTAAMAVAWINLGKGNAGIGEFDKTFEYFDQAMEVFVAAQAELQRSEVLGYYAEHYAMAGRFEEAYQYAVEFREARQKMLSEQNFAKLEELRESYETEQKELRIEALEAEQSRKDLLLKQQETQSELDQTKLASERRTRDLLIVFLLLGIILIICLILGYRYKASANRELRELHEALNQKNTDLKKLHDQKKQLIAIVSHDLRNPLNGILGMVESLRDGQGSLSKEEYSEALDIVSHSALRANEIVKNLLDSERIKSGKLTLNQESCLIVEIAGESIVENEVHAKMKGQELITSINVEETVPVTADREALLHACSNLISNAIKYSPQGKPITIQLTDNEDRIRFAVIDEGPGISQEDQKKLFIAYSTTSLKTTGGEHSVGLGLSIVKSLIEGMGGEVGCISEPGKGALFYFEVPKN